MLQTAEALLFDRAFDAARAQQRRARIAVIGVQPQNIHDLPVGALALRRSSSTLMSTSSRYPVHLEDVEHEAFAAVEKPQPQHVAIDEIQGRPPIERQAVPHLLQPEHPLSGVPKSAALVPFVPAAARASCSFAWSTA